MWGCCFKHDRQEKGNAVYPKVPTPRKPDLLTTEKKDAGISSVRGTSSVRGPPTRILVSPKAIGASDAVTVSQPPAPISISKPPESQQSRAPSASSRTGRSKSPDERMEKRLPAAHSSITSVASSDPPSTPISRSRSRSVSRTLALVDIRRSLFDARNDARSSGSGQVGLTTGGERDVVSVSRSASRVWTDADEETLKDKLRLHQLHTRSIHFGEQLTRRLGNDASNMLCPTCLLLEQILPTRGSSDPHILRTNTVGPADGQLIGDKPSSTTSSLPPINNKHTDGPSASMTGSQVISSVSSVTPTGGALEHYIPTSASVSLSPITLSIMTSNHNNAGPEFAESQSLFPPIPKPPAKRHCCLCGLPAIPGLEVAPPPKFPELHLHELSRINELSSSIHAKVMLVKRKPDSPVAAHSERNGLSTVFSEKDHDRQHEQQHEHFDSETLYVLKVLSKQQVKKSRGLGSRTPTHQTPRIRTPRGSLRTVGQFAIDLLKTELAVNAAIRHPNLVTAFQIINSPMLEDIYFMFEYAEFGACMTWQNERHRYVSYQIVDSDQEDDDDDSEFPEVGDPVNVIATPGSSDPPSSSGKPRPEMVRINSGDTGGSLRSPPPNSGRRREKPPQGLPLSDARRVFGDALRGLLHLHSLGIVHRDLKPDNLLVAADGTAKIADFGSAYIFDDEELPTQMLSGLPGTRFFTPPEVAAESQNPFHGPSADIWAMGVTLFALVYGLLPFPCPNGDIIRLFESITKEPPAFPSHLVPPGDSGSESELALAKDLISQILQKDPRKRPTISQIIEHPFMQSVPRSRSTSVAP